MRQLRLPYLVGKIGGGAVEALNLLGLCSVVGVDDALHVSEAD
jgi:hypothetical protein